MVFTKDEATIIISTLSTYKESNAYSVLPADIKAAVLSSLSKLEAYTFLTYFTKQDYSAMGLALDFIIHLHEITERKADDVLYMLFDRVLEMAC